MILLNNCGNVSGECTTSVFQYILHELWLPILVIVMGVMLMIWNRYYDNLEKKKGEKVTK